MADLCLFCNEPATRYCDRAIGMPWVGNTVKMRGHAAYKVTTMEAMLSTDYQCSAPCCAAHAHVHGFICGEVADTIDHCEGCHGVQWPPVGLATPEEIESRRSNLHADYRRRRIRAIPQEQEAANG